MFLHSDNLTDKTPHIYTIANYIITDLHCIVQTTNIARSVLLLLLPYNTVIEIRLIFKEKFTLLTIN